MGIVDILQYLKLRRLETNINLIAKEIEQIEENIEGIDEKTRRLFPGK